MKNVILCLLLICSFKTVYTQNIKKLGLIFESKVYHFGDIEQWNNQPAVFRFTNKSKNSITILPLFAENDLDVIVPEKPIAPGETILIKAVYYTDGKGLFNKTFPIYFDFLPDPVFLKISGNIKSLSPHAYIECPMAKPELSKSKIELIGNVIDQDSEFPISGSEIQIVGLQNRKELTLFSNGKGDFGTKLPTGNYMIKISHPNYLPYESSVYVGRTSPPLRIQLGKPIFANNTPETSKTQYDKTTTLKEDNKTVPEKEIIELVDNTPKTSATNRELSKAKENVNIEADIPKTKLNEAVENPTEIDKNNQAIVVRELEKTIAQNENPKQSKSEYTQDESDEPLDKITKQNEDDKNENRAVEKKEPNEKINTNNKPRERIIAKEDIETKDNTAIGSDTKNTLNTIDGDGEQTKFSYTISIIDKKSSEAISEAYIYMADLFDKKNKIKQQSNARGVSTIATNKSSYRLMANADGYISNELSISEHDTTSHFTIYLSPVSDLYTSIYEAKKLEAKQEDNLLDKLSFGKTQFSFAQNNREAAEESKTDVNLEQVEMNKTDDTLVVEKQKNTIPIVQKTVEQALQTSKEDSLMQYIVSLEDIRMKNEELKAEKERVAQAKKQDEIQEAEENKINQIKMDSLKQYIDELTAKNNATIKDLEKIKEEKEAIEKEQLAAETLHKVEAEIAVEELEDDFSSKKYSANNILFLIDISTSMGKEKKMEMLKASIKNLVGILRDIDRVAIIAYNQKTKIVLESISGDNKSDIIYAIDSLKTGGLTNGVKGITTAYDMLDYYFVPSGNNQIILATDGLFSKYNNDMTENELNRMVKKQADKGIKLTVVGFGKDEEGEALMYRLAKNGNGQYIQIKNEYMTRDVLIREIKLNSEIK